MTTTKYKGIEITNTPSEKYPQLVTLTKTVKKAKSEEAKGKEEPLKIRCGFILSFLYEHGLKEENETLFDLLHSEVKESNYTSCWSQQDFVDIITRPRLQLAQF